MDCETTIIFTKDPQYIVNAHSWPDEIKKKEKEAKQEKTANRNQTPNKRGFMDNLGKGVTDIFSKKSTPNTNNFANEDKETEDKSNIFKFYNLKINFK